MLPPLLRVTRSDIAGISVRFDVPTSWWRSLWNRGPDQLHIVLDAHQLTVGEQRFGYHELADARFECEPPHTTLVLVDTDGREHRTVFLRRGPSGRALGVTRRQRDWLVAMIAGRAAEVRGGQAPEALAVLREVATGQVDIGEQDQSGAAGGDRIG